MRSLIASLFFTTLSSSLSISKTTTIQFLFFGGGGRDIHYSVVLSCFGLGGSNGEKQETIKTHPSKFDQIFISYPLILLVLLVFLLFCYFYDRILVLWSLCLSAYLGISWLFFLEHVFVLVFSHKWNISCTAVDSLYICRELICLCLLSQNEGGGC